MLSQSIFLLSLYVQSAVVDINIKAFGQNLFIFNRTDVSNKDVMYER